MDFITIAQNLGVPVACMALMSYALFKVGKFMGEFVLKPLISAHVEFLKKLEASMDKQGAMSQAILDKLEKLLAGKS